MYFSYCACILVILTLILPVSNTKHACLFFIDMTYVLGQFIRYIFLGHQAISSHFPRWPPIKLVGTITYEPLIGLHSNLLWLFYRFFWWSDWLLRWIHLKQNGCRSHFKKNWQGGRGGHFFNYFLILIGILPMVFVNRRGSEYFTKGVSDWNLIVLPPKKMNLDVNILI